MFKIMFEFKVCEQIFLMIDDQFDHSSLTRAKWELRCWDFEVGDTGKRIL